MEAVNALLLFALGLITAGVMGVLKSALVWVKNLPDPAKSVAVLLLGLGGQFLVGFTGIEDLPADPFTWDGAAINSLFLWLIAQGAHAAKKAIRPPPLI